MSRQKNAARNAVWGVFYQALALLLPFITRTIIIRVIGSEYVGLSGLFSAIIQVLNITELGFNSAIVFNLYKPIAEKDEKQICALMGYYKRIYRIIGAIIVVAGLCVLPFLENLIKGSWPSDINLVTLYLIYLSNTVLGYFLFAYKAALLTAHQRSDVISKISGAVTLLLNVFQIIILFTTKNYYYYAILIPLFTIVGNIWRGIVVDKYYPQYKPKGKISKETRCEIRKQVGGLMIQKICGTTRNSLDSVFISAFIGLVDIAIYGNYYFVMSSIHAVMMIGAEALQAGLGDAVARETKERNFYFLKILDFIYMWLGTVMTVGMVCMYQDFMKIWVGDGLVASLGVVLSISFYFYLLCMGDIRSLYTGAAGIWWHGKLRAVIETIMNILLNWVLIKAWGITGVILATVFSILFVNFPYGSYITFKYYFKFFGFKEYLLYQLRFFIVAIITCGATYFVCNMLPDNSIGLFIVKGLICVILTNIILLVLNLRYNTFKEAKVYLKNFIRSNIITKG